MEKDEGWNEIDFHPSHERSLMMSLVTADLQTPSQHKWEASTGESKGLSEIDDLGVSLRSSLSTPIAIPSCNRDSEIKFNFERIGT
jgi:hypothetical protein